MRVSTVLFLSLAATGALGAPVASAASVEPTLIPGNPSCTSLGYDEEFKLDPPAAGIFPAFGGHITVELLGLFFNWSSTVGINAVIAKGGPNANLYEYDPPSLGDDGLSSPINPATGQPYGLSHISFCYNRALEVTKTANTSFKRKWAWEIEKTGDQTALTLAIGQQFDVNYEVTVDLQAGSPVDSDFAVSGEIEIHNPTSTNATITSVTDEVSVGIAMAVDCGVSFPYVLAGGATLTCSYGGALPDGADRINTATVVSTGVEGGTATADVDFSSATVHEVDECVDVSDTFAGPLGEVCAEDAPKTFNYTRTIGPFTAEECGEIEVPNTASFVTNDTGKTGSDDHNVIVTVPCVDGCTLTQGYWKTHSEKGPAPYDDTWALLPDGAHTVFFLSGQTWYQVFWTAPAGGNAYYILAHQYMAAILNQLNGAATTPEVDAAIAAAEAFFIMNTPTSPLTKVQRAAAIKLAGTLDKYNNGLIGPGHCDE